MNTIDETARRGFGSDNHSGVHPRILDAIARANSGHMPSYGTDDLTRRAEKVICEHFGEGTRTHFVFNGTAANVLALSPFVRSYHAILTSEHSHLVNDECAAPEKNLGCQVIRIPSPDGKITPEAVAPFLIRRGDQHFAQARMISITQPTELGTLYERSEIKDLADFAHKNGLYLHVDGARLVNAAEALGCERLGEITTDCGVDVVSLGGTKNGLLFGEAVLFLPRFHGASQQGSSQSIKSQTDNVELSNFKFVRKQMMQLPSKTRFLAAQFEEFLGTGLWRENARHAISMARRLAEGLSKIPHAEITQKTQANAVFVKFPKELVSILRETAFFYVWNEHSFECRLMTTWDTTEADVDRFLDVAKSWRREN